MENKEKKKLYIITQKYPYGHGEKTFVEPELMYLINSDKFDITVISNATKTSAKTSELPNEVELKWTKSESLFSVPLKTLKYICKYFASTETKKERKEIELCKKRLGKILESLFFYIRSQLFWESIHSENIDFDNAIVYTYWCNIETLAFAFYKAEYKNMQLISRIHRFDLYDEATKYGRQPFRQTIDEKLNKLFFIAKEGKEYYISKMQESSKYVLSRLGTSNNIILEELENKQKKHDSFLIVSCSNIIPVKRIELIIDALETIDDIKIEWIHFGDGSMKHEIENRAIKKLQKKENITYSFMGHINNETIMLFYENNYVDCFITTSLSEGCPVTIQEAMSYGIPIIGTAVGEIPLMIDGNGVLLDSNPREKEIVNAIKILHGLSMKDKTCLREKSRKLWEIYFDRNNNYKMFIDELIRI